jgi:hypothetical protein
MPTTGRKYLNGIPMTGSGRSKNFALPKALATFAKPVTSKIAPDDTINHFGHLPRNPADRLFRDATCCDAANSMRCPHYVWPHVIQHLSVEAQQFRVIFILFPPSTRSSIFLPAAPDERVWFPAAD